MPETPQPTDDADHAADVDADGAEVEQADAPRAVAVAAPLSFVRRSGRMTPAQERAWETLSPRFLLELPRGDGETSVAASARLDPEAVWGRRAPLVVEVGSGQGHALLAAAEARPDTDFLGIEVFRAGLARTMIRAARADLSTLRLIEANAPEVLDHALAAGSVDELWIFFPDPWHKSRHVKRRLIAPEFARTAARALRPGGVIRLATDWEDYARQMRRVLDARADFTRGFEGEWAERFADRPLTAFERKGEAAGRQIRDLVYRRR